MDGTETEEWMEKHLEQMYGQAEPDPEFVERLYGKLLVHRREAKGQPGIFPKFELPFRSAAQLAAASVLVLVMGTLMFLGTKDTWAGKLRTIQFLPGAGFIETEEVQRIQVLAEPVEVKRGGVTVRVSQVVVTSKSTQVAVEVDGIHLQKSPSRGPILDASLRLPDGRYLPQKGGNAEVGETVIKARMTFPPIPQGEHRATLHLRVSRAPGSHSRPEQFDIPLTLYPANNPTMAGFVINPDEPDIPPQTHDGITVSLLRVAYTGDSTAIQVKAEWKDPEETVSLGDSVLYDDVGHVYNLPPDLPGGSPSQEIGTPSKTWTDVRAPISAMARRLTYAVYLEADTHPQVKFTLDLGEHPRPGDSWPLDVEFRAAGVPIHIRRATLGYDPQQDRYAIIFQASSSRNRDALPVEMMLWTKGSGGGGASGDVLTGNLYVTLHTRKGDPMPRGKIEVVVGEVMLRLRKPWIFSWNISRPSLSGLSPVTMHPNASATDHGITLRIPSVTMTDRVTAVDIKADVPSGTSFVWAEMLYRTSSLSDTYLRDDKGRRYLLTDEVRWCRDDATGKVESPIGMPISPCAERFQSRYTFEPVKPGTRELILRVPGVYLFVPDRKTIEIPVPNPGSTGESEWQVDIRTRVAGYEVHFTKARFSYSSRPDLWLISDPVKREIDGRSLSGFRIKGQRKLSRAGRFGNMESAFVMNSNMIKCMSMPSPNCQEQGGSDVMLLQIPLDDIELPTTLKVTFEGAEVLQKGNWELHIKPTRLFWQQKGKTIPEASSSSPTVVATLEPGRGAGGQAPTASSPTPLPTVNSSGMVTVQGKVLDVALSARIITLQAEGGTVNVALTDGTILLGPGGEPIELRDIRPGALIEATGRPSTGESVIAMKVQVSKSSAP